MTIYIYIPWFSPCPIFAMAKDDHGTRKPSIHGMSGSASSTSRPWSPKVPMESNVYDVFFSIFFDDPKKSDDVFPESMDHHHLYHVFQWELPCWPPFFTSVLFVIWGLSPNFCTGSCYRGKIQGSSGDTGDTPFLNIPYLVANYPRIVVVGSFTPVIDMG
jgi:hypothetical protein